MERLSDPAVWIGALLLVLSNGAQVLTRPDASAVRHETAGHCSAALEPWAMAYADRLNDFERAGAKYRASRDLARACMGDEAFDAEWAQVLADLREAEGRE